MASTIYGITDQGFVRKPLSEIINGLNSKLVAAFGSTFDTSPESPDGQVIGIIGNEISLAWEQAQYAFNGYRPGAMQGVGLDAICELTNTVRFVDVPTSVDVYCGGPTGLIQTAGLIVGDGTNTFKTLNDVVLPGTVTAQCTTTGEINVPANTVTKIVTTNAKATSVTNPDAGTTGINYEQDADLRVRRDRTTISSGSSTTEAIYSNLSKLNLKYVRIRDNDTKAYIGSQPPNTIWVVVDGGVGSEIARAIYASKTGGVPTFGNESLFVQDSKGYPHQIAYSRTTNQNIYLKVSARRLPTANLNSNDVKLNIQAAVADYINSLQPGAPVAWSFLVQPILNSTSGIQVDDIEIGVAANSLAQTTLTMDIDKRPYTEAAFIEFVDTTNT